MLDEYYYATVMYNTFVITFKELWFLLLFYFYLKVLRGTIILGINKNTKLLLREERHIFFLLWNVNICGRKNVKIFHYVEKKSSELKKKQR